MDFTKIYKILLLVSICAATIFFFMWRIDSNSLKNTKKELCNAEETINKLQKENENLVKYNKLKDIEIKNIESLYKDKLNNIPADKCGDTKPSQELLKYLRKNK